MTTKHKLFISYHHANDQFYKDTFVRQFSSAFVDWSVGPGDIDTELQTETIRQKIRDEWLRESTVTVVLVGHQTWQRKHVDWEISSSLRQTSANPRSGVLGILLPSHPSHSAPSINYRTVPPRLYDNLLGSSPFAKLYRWPTTVQELQGWIHSAYIRRSQDPPPNNARDFFRNNRTGAEWVS